MHRSTFRFVLLATLGLTWVTAARADMASAEALFKSAKKLFDEGKIAEACSKFAESQRLDPSAGTLLNLARCHKEQGRTASAWAEFLAAKRLAKSQGRVPLVEEAQRQADALAPALSKLTVVVEAPVDGIVVTRNGERVTNASFGTPLPVDPGRYEIVAVAPGYLRWEKRIQVEGGADQKTLSIPPLEAVPAEPAPGPTTEPVTQDSRRDAAPASHDGKRVAGFAVGGAGIAVTATGLVFGVLARSKYRDAEGACPTFSDCSAEAMSLRRDANTFANIANVGVAIGLAAVTTGVVLFVVHKSKRPEREGRVSVGPVAVRGGGGAALSGAF